MGAERGQMLSHYRLVEKIGEGGLGVWEAAMKHGCKIRTLGRVVIWTFLVVSIPNCIHVYMLYNSRIREVDGSNLYLPNTQIMFWLNGPVFEKTGDAYVGKARLEIGFLNQDSDDSLRVDTNDIQVLPQLIPWSLGRWTGICARSSGWERAEEYTEVTLESSHVLIVPPGCRCDLNMELEHKSDSKSVFFQDYVIGEIDYLQVGSELHPVGRFEFRHAR